MSRSNDVCISTLLLQVEQRILPRSYVVRLETFFLGINRPLGQNVVLLYHERLPGSTARLHDGVSFSPHTIPKSYSLLSCIVPFGFSNPLWFACFRHALCPFMCLKSAFLSQVLVLQFSTELMFVAIKPFTFEFFVVLVIKAVLHICVKGGLLLKLYISLNQRFYSLLHNFRSEVFLGLR